MTDTYASKPRVEVDGVALLPEHELQIERVIVDDHVALPSMFVLRFRDPAMDLLGRAHIAIGSAVRVLAGRAGQEADEPLIDGEVTAIEAEFDATGSHALVRGYDASHRLHRGRRTDTYRNMTDADIARMIARRAGIPTGRIDETSTVHRHVSQANQTDWDLLARRAHEIGFEFGIHDGKLDFKAPADAQDAPQPGDLSAIDPLQLVLGANLTSLKPRVTSAEQVTDVYVRGWDPEQKQALVGRAPAKTSSAALSLDAKSLAATFGEAVYVGVDRPLATQDEVDRTAVALADRIAGSFAEAEGTALGNPTLRAGTTVSIGLVGEPFEGVYSVTSSRHIFDVGGYRTYFSASGRAERSLLSLSGAHTNGTSASKPINGVVVAQVTNVSDESGQGRVKLTFPWLSDTYETDWVRLVQPGAGDQRGAVIVPEVNDEVLVAFEHGDVRRPYVLGGLYNGVDKPLLGDGFIDHVKGEVRRRGFVSRKGHCLIFFDDDDSHGMSLISSDKKLKLSLNASDTVIKISSDGDVVIEAGGDVSIEGKSIDIKAQSGVTIDGGGGAVTVKGTQIKLN